MIPKCNMCRVKERVKRADGFENGWWSIETMKPRLGQTAVTQQHFIRLGRELRTIGHCLALCEAETACGLKFKTEVDSSD